MATHQDAEKIAQFGAGDNWQEMSKIRKAEAVKEVSDSLQKGIPATVFAERAIDAWKAQPSVVEEIQFYSPSEVKVLLHEPALDVKTQNDSIPVRIGTKPRAKKS